MAPEQSLAYLLAASIHIAQKTELERALHLLDQALEKDKANRASDPAGLRRIAAEAYALKACALTLLERHEEAEAALNHAFNEASGEHRPRFASYQRIVGQVMRLRGEREKAREHFNRAREIDPLGLNNRLATEELEKLEQETGDG
jgi:tetratricopeptide (TPR) repeat protein